jgi:UDP-glucose 4-epimerase
VTGSKSKIKLIAYSEAYAVGFEDMQRRVPDISKIANTVGWKPSQDLDNILTDVINSFSK